MYKKILITSASLLIPLFIIWYGGGYLQIYLSKKDRMEIKKNGILNKAVIYNKNTHKGKFVYFRYVYNHEIYENSEKSNSLYYELSLGDSVNILLDSTNPYNSYIINIK